MFKKKTFLIIIIIFLKSISTSYSTEDFFNNAKKEYDSKNYNKSKFLFQRNIIFNPKDSKSYLYLAKIYNNEKNQQKELKNLNTALLLEPNNEEATYMMINIQLKKSNYEKVKKLKNNFLLICSTLCNKEVSINERLKNIEPKNES
tara:strand:+ start:465 stop:902 length:438 start_codon:yes stop_codon:yes gene_type:complete